MTNNEVLKSVRFTLDMKNREVAEIMKSCGEEVSVLQVANMFKSDDDDDFIECTNEQIHAFLDGLILERRGPSDNPKKFPTNTINNNTVLRKLRIAFEMRDTDMIATMKTVGFTVSKGELGALFRAPNHKNFVKCGDQFLRNFLKGLARQFRPDDK